MTMLDKLESVTKPEKQGLVIALALGGILGLAGGYNQDVAKLFDKKAKHRQPPYLYPDVTQQSLLETAYKMQPFFDIRRQGVDTMFAAIGESPSALLTAIAAYRNEGYAIDASGLGAATIADVEAFIQWSTEHRLQEAADMARTMLETYTPSDIDMPVVPGDDLHAF
jgi:hypothetical protein